MNLISDLVSPSLREASKFEGHPVPTTQTLPWVPAHSTTLAGCTKAHDMFPPRNHTPGCSPSMEETPGCMDRREVQHPRGGQEGQYTQIKRSQWTPKTIRVSSDNKTVLCWFTCWRGRTCCSIPHFWIGTTYHTYCKKRQITC